MPDIDLELQLKFLKQLEEALTEAMGKYASDDASKLKELEYMKSEVDRATRIVAVRMECGAADGEKFSRSLKEKPYASGLEAMA